MNKNFKLDKTNIEDIVDLTSLQEGILFHYLKDVRKNLYFVQLSLEIQGVVKSDYFQEAWNKVVENNEMLRTLYRWEKLNKPIQVILKESNVDIRYYDLSKKENTLESEYQKIKLNDNEESFDLRKVPFRLTLCKIKTDKYRLLISNHHIIYDGWSNGIILKEFLNYYNNPVTRSSLKVNKKAQFKNYLKLNRELSIEDESFWKDYLKGFEPKNVFSFKSNSSLQDNSNNQSHRFSISEDKFSKLKQVCKSQKLTIADILYGVWGILLSKYSGESDMLFGTTISGRNIKFEGIEQMVGLFINTIPIRIKITPDKPLISVLKENAKQTLERGRFENVPLLNILDNSGYKENDLIESIFVVENYPLDKENLQHQNELAFKSFTIKETTNYKLTVSALISDEIEISFNYINAYFQKELIENIEKHFVRIIDTIIDDNKSAIQSLDLLSDIEKHQLLYEFNNTKVDYPKDKTIHHLLEEQANKIPDTKAIIYGDEQLSYEELNKRSEQLASYLAYNGIVSGDKVGLILERSVEMLIGIFGILKAGGVYVPIDPKFPKNRIKYILESSESKLVLSERIYTHNIEYPIPFISFEDIDFNNITASEYKPKIVPEDLSYIIYTSGSTGNPKGVQVEHRSLTNLLYFLQDQYPITTEDSYLLKTSYCFDVSISEIFGWILGGGKLSILEKDQEKEPSKIIDAILKNKITHINYVPTALKSFSQSLSIIDQTGLKSLKFLLIAGEALYQDHLQEFNKLNLDIHIANLYGPTEATVYTSYYKVIPGTLETVPIGKPISNYSIYILDNRNKLQPIGMPGELCVSGIGLARGYMGNPALTSEKFIDHPFTEGERLYRTGDLARWLPDGNMEFLGRIDDQVKIRGFRIELGEIENALQKHEHIKECVVLAIEEKGDKYLCAYIISEEEFNKEEIRTYLSVSLPDYMIPSYFVDLDSLPLNASGKVNRKALPSPEIKAGDDYAAPSTKIEENLLEIWSKVLNINKEDISVNANFFSIGGHSLKATILISRIHKEIGVEFPLQDLFLHSTIKSQASQIAKSIKKEFVSIPKAKEQSNYPLSSAQKRLYLLQQFDLTSTAYNMPYILPLGKEADKSKIKEVFKQLINRHESFRTSFITVDQEPVQLISKNVAFELEELSIESTELENTRNKFIKPFDLSQAHLLRVAIVDIKGEDSLLIDMHHIISDGISHTILEKEFQALLSGEKLAPLPLQYRDYSQWQNSKEQQERIKNQEQYWLTKFEGEIPVLNLPMDYTRPLMQSHEGATVNFVLSKEETEGIKSFTKENDLTLYMSLLSAFNILLSKLSGQNDIVVGTPIAGRNHADLENIVGMFVNTLSIPNEIKGEKTIREFVSSLKQTVLGAYENQNYQFEDLVNKVSVERDTSRNPIFDVMFNLLNQAEYSGDIPGYNNPERVHQIGISKFDLTLIAVDYGEQLMFSFEYCTKLFKAETIDRFIAYFKQIVSQLARKPEIKISAIDILSKEEKHQLLYEFNNTKADYPKDKTVHQLFQEQVEKTPENVAVSCDGNVFTYNELNRKANIIAHHIREIGIARDDIVSIFLDRSIETVFSMLGVLKSGGAYLPLDPDYPDERIDFILNDSRSKIVISTKELSTRIEFDENIICVEEMSELENNFSNIEIINKPSDLCYIIYTSGTTGMPKGVMVEHKNLVRLFFNERFQFDFSENDIWTMFHSHCFDFSVWEMYGALLYGGKLIVIPKIVAKDVEEYYKLLREEKVTVLNQTPSAFYNLSEIALQKPGKSLENLRYVIFGGEALKPNKLAEWFNIYSDVKLINMYGITETTVHVTYKEICENEIANNISNIGTSIPTLTTYVVDENLKLVPKGVAGELLIGGDGLSRGYLGREDLTRERFIKDSYFGSEILYRSGDLVKMQSDGDLEYLGRIDDQVQLRGFRIELGEIENTLIKHENINECVVLAIEENNDKYLCAYVVSKEELNHDELRAYILAQLPDYMVPSYFIELESLPLNANGKINRKVLPAPQIKAGDDYVAPSNEIEAKLLEIWSELLNIDKEDISVNANFFSIGGHSLKATILTGNIHKELGVEFPLREIFLHQTIKSQASQIEISTKKEFVSIPKAKEQEHYPLSSAQKRMYLLQEMDLESTAYNMPYAMPLEAGVDKNKIEEVFQLLINRHESFRTSFEIKGEEPVQRIHEQVEFTIEELSIEKDEVQEKKHQFIQAFDLSKAPFLRVTKVDVKGEGSLLMIDMHHIISDGVSHAILEQDFQRLCSGEDLSPLSLQYKDYSQWQNSEEQQVKVKKQKDYWISKFEEDIPILDLPTDYVRPLIQSHEGASVNFALSKQETQYIKSLAKENDLTLYMSILSVFNILLSKLSRQEDLIVGTPIAGRSHADLAGIVGMFVNTLAIRNNIEGDQTLPDYLKEIKHTTLEAFENQDYQFEDLVENVSVERDISRNPLIDVMFNLLNQTEYSGDLSDFTNDQYVHTSGIAKFDLTLIAVDYQDQLLMTFEYCTKLFKSETVERYIKYFKNIIPQLEIKKDDKISSIEIIPEEEKQQIINRFNNTRSEYCKETTIHELFEEEVKKNPNQIAVVNGDKELSYGELNEHANQIAHYLIERGVNAENETIVGIELEPSYEFVICMIGVLKSGGAYLPIDKNLPEQRKKNIVKNSKLKILIHSNSDYKEIDSNIELTNYKDIDLEKFKRTNPNIKVSITNLAYVIYTSGTSGNPKGTLLEHKGIVSENTFWKGDLEMNPMDRCIQFANISFDGSVWEICSCLLNGASLYIPEKLIKDDARLFENYLISNKITVAALPPVYAENLNEE
ncbi:MAG: amino acid adenylation domain-containing protein, partial [Bacteroidales bacterium]|nr:amino acid adenylation domain-containing protein [Bacteroidales bacterium]